MELQYSCKKPVSDILNFDNTKKIDNVSSENLLIKGDNFDVMKSLLVSGYKNSVDLVYIDPPFATNNVFKAGTDRVSTISNSHSDNEAYDDRLTGDAYFEFIRERLYLIKELMSEQGSIYLHIDYKVGHYIKIIMDEVFGESNFKNDIARIKCNPKNFHRKSFGNIKDLILFYTKTKHAIWNEVKEELTEAEATRLFSKTDKDGRAYTTVPLHAPGETKDGVTGGEWKGLFPPAGRHWRSSPKELDKLDEQGLIEWSKTGNPRKKIYLDEKKGKKSQDIWDFKDYPYPRYPTEKNADLLKKIILTSSNEKSLVMDCFCGSGTTLEIANKLDRRFIGIDKSEVAISVVQERLNSKNDTSMKECNYSYYNYLSPNI